MMNIMLLSVSVWSGASGATRDLFHWLSAAIALPTVAYAGRAFFRSAWRAVRHGRTNMDVPISIGVLIATAVSLHETSTHHPPQPKGRREGKSGACRFDSGWRPNI